MFAISDPRLIVPHDLDDRVAGREVIYKAAHGFTIGTPLYYTGSAYAKAQADSAAHAEVVGVVQCVLTADVFVLQSASGRITGLTGLTAGTVYFLDPSTPGAYTSTEPVTAGQVSKPLLVADSTTSAYFFNFRGEIIVNSATGGTVSWNQVINESGSSLANWTSRNGGTWTTDGTIIRQADISANERMLQYNTSVAWGGAAVIEMEVKMNTTTPGNPHFAGFYMGDTSAANNNMPGWKISNASTNKTWDTVWRSDRGVTDDSLAITAITSADTVWTKYRVCNFGEYASFFINGVLSGSLFSPQSGASRDCGYLRLLTYNLDCFFRNIKMWILTYP
jgi:hypothetical protein